MKNTAIAVPTPKRFATLDDIELAGKRALVRMDLNVPMVAGRVSDNTRVLRLLPTIRELLAKKARIVILSHLGRPKGKYVTDFSLAPLVDTLSEVLPGVAIKFGVDCVGPEAADTVASLEPGQIALLENLRFHPGEEKNDPDFARALAAHGDIYINDAFSCSHRAHSSVVGITHLLPFVAGRLMEEELNNLERMFAEPKRPMTAIIGGSKVSTKLALIENLLKKVDTLVIGGAMANTFLLAQGHTVGNSLVEPDLVPTALHILRSAKQHGCTVLLPSDVIHSPHALGTAGPLLAGTGAASAIPAGRMAFDVGNDTIRNIMACLAQSKTVFWNGPLGAFETRPYDVSTLMIAREIAQLTQAGTLVSVAGGGDTIAALSLAGLAEQFSYVSTAGGAFLEWLEGKTLPGVAALQKTG
jgi:phosphoglycerate kinase